MTALRTLALLPLAAAALLAQGLNPAKIAEPPTDSWPSYHGDYSGRRYSPLDKINDGNIGSLSLAWIHEIDTGGGRGSIKATPLQVDGVLYFTTPDNAFAVDARSGREIWHFEWESAGGIHIGNRGAAIYGNWLYFETPDCHLVSLNIHDGTERWRKEICELDQFYFGSVAPVIVKNRVIVGVSGDDLDRAGYLQAMDPETGETQWRWYVTPQKMGDPGSETWPNEAVMKNGGGMTWQPITYDPELDLIYVSTGNPQPVIAHKNREGDNLFTESVVALNPDNGEMKWYFQASPHDTHDWDNTEAAVLIDAEFEGKPRKLLAQASRNGYFFVLDRTNGKALVSKPFVNLNWSLGVNDKGQPIPNAAKHPQLDGALVSPNQGGTTNWQPPSFSPKTGLFYTDATKAYSVYYIFDTDDNPQGWGGTDRGGYSQSGVRAIDYRTGEVRWAHEWEGTIRGGVLSTTGNLVFAGDSEGNFVALNATTGDPLWHAGLGSNVSNGPVSYELDGEQYVIVGAGDTLFAFVMH
jgi:alcohol dehydrogenase (cytochrome c)